MSVKNREVEEAKERANRLLEEATKNAQESMERKAREGEQRTQAVLKTIPSQLTQSETNSASSNAANGGSVHNDTIREIEG